MNAPVTSKQYFKPGLPSLNCREARARVASGCNQVWCDFRALDVEEALALRNWLNTVLPDETSDVITRASITAVDPEYLRGLERENQAASDFIRGCLEALGIQQPPEGSIVNLEALRLQIIGMIECLKEELVQQKEPTHEPSWEPKRADSPCTFEFKLSPPDNQCLNCGWTVGAHRRAEKASGHRSDRQGDWTSAEAVPPENGSGEHV